MSNTENNEYTFNVDTRKGYANGLTDMRLTAPARLTLHRLINGTGRITFNLNVPADVEALGGFYELWANGYVKRNRCALELTNEPRRLNVVPRCTGAFLESWAKVYSDYPLEKAKLNPFDV